MNVGTRTCQLSFDQITSVCVSLCCRRPWCDAVAVCVSCHMAYSVLLVMQCTVAFRWCILSLPTLYIPLLDSSSGGGNRMCSCVDPFFFVLATVVLLAMLFSLTGYISAFSHSHHLFCQQMVLPICLHQFHLGHIF